MKEIAGPSKGEEQNGIFSMAQQKDSAAAPSPSPGGKPLTISFTVDEFRYLETEIDRLSQQAIICRMLGSKPSRGEMKDLLYEKMLLEGSSINDIQFMGKGFLSHQIRESRDCPKTAYYESSRS